MHLHTHKHIKVNQCGQQGFTMGKSCLSNRHASLSKVTDLVDRGKTVVVAEVVELSY